MSDRRRKGSADRVRLDCEIDVNCKLALMEIAGEFALGWAIEKLVQDHCISRTKATSTPHLVDSGKKVQ